MLRFDETTEEKNVSTLHSQEAEELAQILSTKYNLPYVDLSKLPINTDALRVIPEPEARAAQIAAFKVSGKNLFVAMTAPNNPKTQALLADLRDKSFVVNAYLGSAASLERAWSRYSEVSGSTKAQAGVIDISSEDIAMFASKMQNTADVKRLLDEESVVARQVGGISNLLEIILAGGIIAEASDIHTEPEENAVRLRYRLDGVLHDIAALDHKLYHQLLSRIKLVSGLKLNVNQSAQDGRFTIKIKDTEIEIRTSVLPGAYNESVVLRILNPETIKVTLDTLGIEPALLAIVEKQIAKPNGMVLLTGPTGSGKTTTLYAFLRKVSTSENKIITIEDPIEYHLPGISQTQVEPAKNYTFLSGLRSALRQDPDIIMVGEIRDKETAQIAANSALTGHLVFSTLHTNNAPGTIPRLIDLGVNPKVIDAALNIAMAQRLVRRLCPDCKQAATPTPEEQKLLASVLGQIKKKRSDLALPQTTQLWYAAGCAACNHTGYRGRIGVFEAILVEGAIADLLVSNPNEREIKIAAEAQGILDMRQDGVLKVLAGVTSLDELGRVVDLSEELL